MIACRNFEVGIARPYRSLDRDAVFQLLDFLPALYPRGFQWLDARLEEVLEGKARCTLIEMCTQIAGISIETPKARRTVKLSTIFVHPLFRGYGVGTALLTNCCGRWRDESIQRCYVTVDFKIARDLGNLLRRFSFEQTALIENRYGEGRHEVVFSWDIPR
jgi:ribosomal protein S18 acetylase RimI-like enzyme